MNLIALHGFLGTGKDWDAMIEVVQPKKSFVPNLFSTDKVLLQKDFLNFVESLHSHREIFDGSAKKVNLLGYSMGGRLALHMALQNPNLYSNVILISTHMGVFEEEQKASRMKWDSTWYEKLKTMPWETFMTEWNQQEVFQNSFEPKRYESDYDRSALGHALKQFSSTQHQFNLKEFKAHPGQLTWVVGEKDEKFRAHLNEIKEFRGNKDRYLIVPNKGHRLIFDKNPTWINSVFK